MGKKLDIMGEVIAIICYESTLQWIKNSKVGQICDEMVAKIDNLNLLQKLIIVKSCQMAIKTQNT